MLGTLVTIQCYVNGIDSYGFYCQDGATTLGQGLYVYLATSRGRATGVVVQRPRDRRAGG